MTLESMQTGLRPRLGGVAARAVVAAHRDAALRTGPGLGRAILHFALTHRTELAVFGGGLAAAGAGLGAGLWLHCALASTIAEAVGASIARGCIFLAAELAEPAFLSSSVCCGSFRCLFLSVFKALRAVFSLFPVFGLAVRAGPSRISRRLLSLPIFRLLAAVALYIVLEVLCATALTHPVIGVPRLRLCRRWLQCRSRLRLVTAVAVFVHR